MKTFKTGVQAIVLALLCVYSASADVDVHIQHSEALRGLTMQAALANTGDSRKLGNRGAMQLTFDALGQRFDLALVPNHTLLPASMRADLADRVIAYRGTLNGVSGSWARIVVADGLPRGLIWDGAQMHAIEVFETTDRAAAKIYRLNDVQIAPGALSCSDIAGAKNGTELLAAVASEVTPTVLEAAGATSQISIGVLSDFEFTSDKGSNTEAALVSRMNIVDGIFSEQLGVQLNVARLDTFSSPSDPFSDVTAPSDLLDEVSSYRNTTSVQQGFGLTHLFTGRNLDGTTVGIAYRGALCSRRFGVGLTQATRSETMDALIAAHELGHNFGAPHDGTADSACESTAQDFLMAPRLNGSDTFSACSISEMQSDVNRASCVTELAIADAAVIGTTQASVLLGDTGSIGFEVNSVGGEVVNGVAVDISIPTGVSLESISSSTGNCTTGAGTARCEIGSIASGSGVSVDLSVTTNAVGDAVFAATVSATDDENAGNNQASRSLTVDPAVDLSVTAATGASVTIDQNLTIRPSIRNLASIAATGVTATITPNDGLRIDSASGPQGACSLANGVATCDIADMAAQASVSIDLQVTGLTTGQQSYEFSATAGEVDRNTSNNQISGNVSVNAVAVASDDSDSGGGALGWLSLLLLSMLGAWRRTTRCVRQSASC